MASSRFDGLAQSSQAQQQQQLRDSATAASVFSNGQNFMTNALVTQRINTIDPGFYDCIYGVANTQSTVIQRCYKDIGCCQDGCCSNTVWHLKYGWAVALLVLFCVLVIIGFVATLACWLINRSKDKRVKRQRMMEESQYSNMSTPMPPPSSPPHMDYSQQYSPSPREQYSFEPPHANGYRY